MNKMDDDSSGHPIRLEGLSAGFGFAGGGFSHTNALSTQSSVDESGPTSSGCVTCNEKISLPRGLYWKRVIQLLDRFFESSD